VLRSLLTSRKTYPNMFDAYPPFQIDGNFRGTNGIVEMLLQCRQGEIRLLPALPKAWPQGSITGLRVRGGAEIDIAWQNGRITSVRLHGLVDGAHSLRFGDKTLRLDVKADDSVSLNGDLERKP
jgi:alpha-L-fucosidase 2